LSFELFNPTLIKFNLDIPALLLRGEHGVDLRIMRLLSLTSNGFYSMDLMKFDLDMSLQIDIHLTGGHFDINFANLDISFGAINIFAENTLLGRDPLDWFEISATLKPLYDSVWPQVKPQMEEVLKFVAGELTKVSQMNFWNLFSFFRG